MANFLLLFFFESYPFRSPKQKDFERLLVEVPYGLIGRVISTKTLTIYGVDEKICIQEKLDSLKESWQKKLKW